MLVGLLALAALLVPRPAPPTETFLGRLDDATGRSSSATSDHLP